MTTTDDNKATVRRFVDEIFVQGRKDTVDELLDDQFVAHTWPSTGHPKDDLKAAIDRTSKGLADPTFVIDAMIAEGDQVAARLTTGATQVGPFMGLPPSNKRYQIEEIHWFRLRDGKVVEHWHQMDQMGLMKQLGAMPGGSPSGASGGASSGQTAEPEAAGARSS